MELIKQLISHILYFHFRLKLNISLGKSLLLRTKLKVSDASSLSIFNSRLINNHVHIIGENNALNVTNCVLTNSRIFIEGTDCKLILHDGVKLNNLSLVIRGRECKIELNENSTVGSGGEFVCMGKNRHITIGKSCMIADNVDIWATDSHPIFDINTGTLMNESASIDIDDEVWIGKGSSILKGVKIGKNSIVGMKSVVTHDIEPSSLYVGIPAKKIKDSVTWKRNFSEK